MSYARVAQYLLDDFRVLALFEHEGSESVPEIVGASSFRGASSGSTGAIGSNRLGSRLRASYYAGTMHRLL
jgi:hypothetical protein